MNRASVLKHHSSQNSIDNIGNGFVHEKYIIF